MLKWQDVLPQHTTIMLPGKLDEEQYTMGVSKIRCGPKLKVQSDISYTTVDGLEDNIEFRLGLDLHFRKIT